MLVSFIFLFFIFFIFLFFLSLPNLGVPLLFKLETSDFCGVKVCQILIGANMGSFERTGFPKLV